VVLRGGVSNAGSVVRIGDVVHRPGTPFSPSVQRLLAGVRAHGFQGVPEPLGFGADGRERLRWIEGVVPLPPYPSWAQTDAALASATRLLRGYHDAARRVGTDGEFDLQIADPRGGRVVCHNDLCPENLVFRDGEAVGMLDFDYAAPGRPVFDVAQFARMCVPVDDRRSADQLGWEPADGPGRLRLVADAYGLGPRARAELLVEVDAAVARGGEWIQRRADAGDPNFAVLMDFFGGMERFDRRRRWWADERVRFAAALT
jgi:hypothetical protein